MSIIHILPETLRNQIAAGEVVERPSSVVKELVENALDAGAKNIQVDIEEAGLKKIQVRDDGEGMAKDDAVLAVKRHATSKIKKKEDLFDIHTLGFRGEALASIASVSIFRLETKHNKALSGTRLEVHAGHELEPQECSLNTGTTITVENLFDNIPVRKKFLKTASTEWKHSLGMIEDIAFCQPETGFKVSHNGKESLKLFSESFEERIKHLVSSEIFERLIPVSFVSDTIFISGFVSKPGEIFKTRNNQKIFVNKRAVKNATVQAAVNDAFHSFLEKGAFPAFYIFIDIAPDLVDVNVHPRKSEVNFLRGQEVFSAVRNALLQAFEQKHKEFQGFNSLPLTKGKYPLKAGDGVSNPSVPQSGTSPFKKGESSRPSVYPNTQYTSKSSSSNQKILAPKKILDLGFHQEVDSYDELGGYKIVGQAAKKFLILEKDDRVIFLDQHAVHERARYDEFMKAYKEKKSESQRLLMPEVIQCSGSEFVSIYEHVELLQSLGFELEEFGNNTFQVLALPIHISSNNVKETIVKVCEELGEKGESREVDANIEKALTYLSCRGSIMFGDELSLPEMKAIVKDWLRFAKGLTCPHGRPLGFEMTVQEMEKKVGR